MAKEEEECASSVWCAEEQKTTFFQEGKRKDLFAFNQTPPSNPRFRGRRRQGKDFAFFISPPSNPIS